MINNDHSNSPARRHFTMPRRENENPHPFQKPLRPDDIVARKTIEVERKKFFFSLRKNDRGAFLRIDEETSGRRNTIIIPSTGVEAFAEAIAELTNVSKPVITKR